VRILDGITQPADLKGLAPGQLETLAAELREDLVRMVEANGGHLASNLGVVELTIALHRVFDSPRDKIIWDVGHQSYVHKLLTGRRERFHTLRQFGGLCGFTDRNESPHDAFGAGHASTSVSAATGMAIARVGALSRRLNKIRLNTRFLRAERRISDAVTRLPLGHRLGKRIKRGVKGFLLPMIMWEEMGFAYLGPVDGHNIVELEAALRHARDYDKGPTFIHVITTKGKGYRPAEQDSVRFHGISGTNGKSTGVSYSEIAGRTVLRIARDNPKVVVITPAMLDGTGLNAVTREIPQRVFDVGICEEHAVTFAAGLATQGFVPIVAVYSTFLQRAFDQLVHDVCLQRLPVVFIIDRGGIVGEDGRTHQGTLDLSYLGCIPNLVVAAPRDENELQHLIYTAVRAERPMAIRYPRGSGPGAKLDDTLLELPIGKGEILRTGEDVAILAVGATVHPSLEAAAALSRSGLECTVVNARFTSPLDVQLISETARRVKRLLTVEENVLAGGFGSAVLQMLNNYQVSDVHVKCHGLPQVFVEHGSQAILRSKYGLDATGIASQILVAFPELSLDSRRRSLFTGSTPP
jgi:1-deoxy-D-xylulose-5-phosphate synthase